MGLIEKHLVLVQFLSDIRIKSYVVFFLITFENLLFEDNSPTDHVLLSRELSILYFDLWISFQRKQGASGVSTRGIPRNSIYEDVLERGTFSGFKWKGDQVFTRVEYMKGQNKLYDFEQKGSGWRIRRLTLTISDIFMPRISWVGMCKG